MIVSIVLPAVGILLGVLLAALSIVLLRGKRLSGRWGVSLLVCALLLAGTGGTALVKQIQSRDAQYGSIYLALCYLEDGSTDPAALYLKRVEDSEGYYFLAAQTLLEQARGNDTVAALRLSMLEQVARGQEQQDGLDRLHTWSGAEEELADTAAALRDQLPLSRGRQEELDLHYELEAGAGSGSLEEYRDVAGAAQSLQMEINQAVGRQDWYTALDRALELVDQSHSADNRLLLAEVIADVTYSGETMTTEQFAAYAGGSGEDTQAREYEALMDEYDRLERSIQRLEQESSGDEADEARMEEEQQLREQADELLIQAQNIFALRAFNSIADIHSLEAQVVRARLYFAMHHEEEAVQTLRDAAGSAYTVLSTNDALVNSLRLVRQVYASENETGVDTAEFREEMQVLLGSVHPELIHLGLTQLVQDLTERIVNDQRNYGAGLYLVSLDTSAYPQIQVQLSGRESAVERVRNQESIRLSDTRTAISGYQVVEESQAQGTNSICFVVDVSGSMGGEPIANAQEALNQFLDNVTGDAELALVSFDDQAYPLVELTGSPSVVKNGVSGMYSGGGTNITSGIEEGARMLQTARGARTMILMTDGQSDIDMGVVQEAAAEHITIFTIGFGDVNDELLQSIADQTGGQYLRAETSDELLQVYHSLQGIIGNTVTITYTVTENVEETYRYFFLRDEEGGVTVRREYTLTEAEPEEPAVTVTSTPFFQSRAVLDGLLARQEPAFRLRITGTGLDTAAQVQIGGLDCGLERQEEDALELNVPAQMPDGVHDLTILTQEGEEYTFPQMLWVGNEVDVNRVQAGSVLLEADMALWLADGRLALRSVDLQDVLVGQETVNTLSLHLDGVMTFQVGDLAGRMVDGAFPDPLDLGDTGTAEGLGVLEISSGDSAYDRGADETILSGSLLLEYGAEQSHIKVSEVNEP